MPTTKHAKLSAIKHPRRRGQRRPEAKKPGLYTAPAHDLNFYAPFGYPRGHPRGPRQRRLTQI